MKLGAVTKIGKSNKITSKKIDDDVMSKSCNIAIFPICDQFMTIQKPYLARIVCKTCIFILQKLKAELKNL